MEMRKVVLDENIIRLWCIPRGKAWKQPDRNNLVLDDKYAMMYRRDFEMLPDYTGSEPTGKYNGKMWKAQYVSRDNRKWYLCWCHDENTVSQEIYISYREILIIDLLFFLS